MEEPKSQGKSAPIVAPALGFDQSHVFGGVAFRMDFESKRRKVHGK